MAWYGWGAPAGLQCPGCPAAGQAGLGVSGICPVQRGHPPGDRAASGTEALWSRSQRDSRCWQGAPAEPARMGLMPAGRASPRSAPQHILRLLSLGSPYPCSMGQPRLRCAVVPPGSPLAAPPCSLPGSRCLRMPRSLVVVPLGCSAAPVPDTSPASSWARGRGRSLLSAPACLLTISALPLPAVSPLRRGAAAAAGTPPGPLCARSSQRAGHCSGGCFPSGTVRRDSVPPLPPHIGGVLCADLRKHGSNALLAGVFAPFSSSPSWFLSFVSVHSLIGMMEMLRLITEVSFFVRSADTLSSSLYPSLIKFLHIGSPSWLSLLPGWDY